AAGYWDLGFDFLGLCERCHACIAPIEAHPARTGGWRCRRCIGCDGFDSVEEAEAWLSEEEALDRCDRGEAPFDAVDILV
nr:hypothetical protein [Thermoanaerobaculales bacterium]